VLALLVENQLHARLSNLLVGLHQHRKLIAMVNNVRANWYSAVHTTHLLSVLSRDLESRPTVRQY
jgi:hypothetical protein